MIIFNIAKQDQQKPAAVKNEGDKNQIVNILTSIVSDLLLADVKPQARLGSWLETGYAAEKMQ